MPSCQGKTARLATAERLHAWQVNYVGPYMLTRLLEPCLRAAGHARVVNVSSVTHRYGIIDNPAAFLSKSRSAVGGQYPVRDLSTNWGLI